MYCSKHPELFQLFLAQTPTAVAMCDRQMRYLLVSSQWLKDWGVDERDIIGRSHYQVFPKEPKRWRETYQHCLASGQSQRQEERLVLPDGTPVWVGISVHPWWQETGEVGGLILWAEKINSWRETEKITDANMAIALQKLQQEVDRSQQAEADLRKSEANLAAAQKLAHFGSWEFDLIAQQISWSEEMFRIFGLDPNQPEPSYAELLQLIHPDEREFWQQRVGQSLNEGKSCEFEHRVVCPDGSIKYIQGYAQPVLNENGQAIKLFGTTLDITDRKQVEAVLRQHQEQLEEVVAERTRELAHSNQQLTLEIADRQQTEKALRQSEARFQRLSANVPGMIYQFKLRPDGSRRFTYVSAACREIWEVEPEQILEDANCLFDGIHPDDLLAFEQSIVVSAQTIEPWNHQWRIITPSGRLKWMQGRSRPEKQANGEIIWDGVVIDISDRKQTEAALQQSEAKFQRMAANVPGMISQFLFRADGTQVALYISSGSLNIYELEPHEIQQNSQLILAMTHPDDWKSLEQAIAQATQTLQPGNWEGRIITPSGKIKWIQSVSRPEKQANGDILWDGVTIDITDRKQAEEERDRFFQIALEMLCIAGFDGYFKQLNPAWETTLGWTQEELKQVPFIEFVHPDDREATHVRAEKASAGSDIIAFENRYRCKDGSYRWLMWAARSLPEKQLIYATARDITQRKQAEEALRQSEEKFRSLYESTSLAVAMVDENGLFDANSAYIKIFGGNQLQELFGKHPAEYSPPIQPNGLDSFTLANEMIALAHKQSSHRFEWMHRRLDGTDFPAEVVLTAIELGDRQIIQAVVEDLTERKQAEEVLRNSEAREREKSAALEQLLRELQRTQSRLIQSEKMSSLGQLVAGVAHEINNPVNFIYGNLIHASEYTQDLIGLVELYAKHYHNPGPAIGDKIEEIDLNFLLEDLPKLLSSMKVGAERIREIVMSLRNFSRLDEAERKAVDIHEGIDSTLMILQNRLKAKPEHPAIQIVKKYGDLPKIECYPGQLNQVFMNLITNAIDALDEYNEGRSLAEIAATPSAIEIITEVNKNNIKIRIIDNGPGMTEEIRQKLFDPFFTTKPIGKGTGLGLSISYQIIVEKHGGQLKCISSPGKGAEFAIKIPIKPV